jgi:hypothetical protein
MKKFVSVAVCLVVMVSGYIIWKNYFKYPIPVIRSHLEKVLKDPDSLKIISIGKLKPGPAGEPYKHTVEVEISATNSWGARVRDHFLYYLDGDKVYTVVNLD